jgi:hypothetical protein
VHGLPSRCCLASCTGSVCLRPARTDLPLGSSRRACDLTSRSFWPTTRPEGFLLLNCETNSAPPRAREPGQSAHRRVHLAGLSKETNE